MIKHIKTIDVVVMAGLFILFVIKISTKASECNKVQITAKCLIFIFLFSFSAIADAIALIP